MAAVVRTIACPRRERIGWPILSRLVRNGFALLDSLETAPKEAQELEKISYLREVWTLHYVRENASDDSNKQGFVVRQTTFEEKPPVGERLESPYDPEVRYANKGKTQW